MANSYRDELKQKTVTADVAAGVVKSGDWVEYGFGVGQPDLVDQALARRVPELSDVKVRGTLALRPRAVVEADPENRHVTYLSWYLSGLERKLADRGLCWHTPMNFGETPDYYRRYLSIDVAILKVAPMDADGFFNFGPSVTYHKATSEVAKTVIVEVDAGMPAVLGVENTIHISEVDYVVDAGAGALPELKNPAPSAVDLAVAKHIVAEIRDGACLQIGIGGMANTVCEMLAHAPVKDLGVHTEMFTNSLMTLSKTGKVTGARKKLHRGLMAYSFAAGAAELYRFLERNKDCVVLPVDQTNLPHYILQNDNVVSICNAVMVDLTGQVCAETAGPRQISGTGGQLQFVRGAYASTGGKSFICLPSTLDRNGQRASRIVPDLGPYNVVTTPRTDVMYVVTEHGMVNLKSKSVPERVRALISIAHPEYRDELEQKAREYRLLPKNFF